MTDAMSAGSALDAWVASALELSEVQAPLGIGQDVLWPLCGMAAYVVMVKGLSLGSGKSPRGVEPSVVQAYNMFIIAVSAGILFSTLYFRILGFTSLQKAYCPIGAGAVSDGLRWCLWAYHVSKYFEYTDTAFLLLKGKEANTLHYWHHLIVTFTSWTWYRCEIEWVADGIIFNTAVHCVMYYYYYLAGIGRPPWWKRYVTSFQIMQFCWSFVCTAIWASYHALVGCRYLAVILISVSFNGWLLFMFFDFYGKTYGKKERPTRHD